MTGISSAFDLRTRILLLFHLLRYLVAGVTEPGRDASKESSVSGISSCWSIFAGYFPCPRCLSLFQLSSAGGSGTDTVIFSSLVVSEEVVREYHQLSLAVEEVVPIRHRSSSWRRRYTSTFFGGGGSGTDTSSLFFFGGGGTTSLLRWWRKWYQSTSLFFFGGGGGTTSLLRRWRKWYRYIVALLLWRRRYCIYLLRWWRKWYRYIVALLLWRRRYNIYLLRWRK